MFIPYFFIKLWLIKNPIALKSTSTHIENVSEILVVLKAIEIYKKIL